MIETTIQNPEKHETLTADSQGRINLGVDYAGCEVEIVVVGSTAHQSSNTGIQQTIECEPMTEIEQKGMLFVRSFGIGRRFLKDDHTAETNEEGSIDLDTITPLDVNWSYGFLLDPKNAARFEFDEDANEQRLPVREYLTSEPLRVTRDDHSEPVYIYENEDGNTSAVLQELVDKIQHIFGYDPTDDLSNIRVHPDDGSNPILFRDPERSADIAIAPRIQG